MSAAEHGRVLCSSSSVWHDTHDTTYPVPAIGKDVVELNIVQMPGSIPINRVRSELPGTGVENPYQVPGTYQRPLSELYRPVTVRSGQKLEPPQTWYTVFP